MTLKLEKWNKIIVLYFNFMIPNCSNRTLNKVNSCYWIYHGTPKTKSDV
jgi:hypothetical protein